MTLYTAQYRYSGNDRLDITVKGNCPAGKLYAPTWMMVTGYKNGSMTQQIYEKLYYDLLIERWKTSSDFRESNDRLIQLFGNPGRDMTFVCFCPPDKFCHRHLLVRWLQHNWSITYGGERVTK